MAEEFSKLKELKLSTDEISSLSKAFKDEKFRDMFREYAEEISDPVNRQRYEEELAQMERDRGMDVKFIHPTPGYTIKTSSDGEKKAFVNICSSDHIVKPSTNPGAEQTVEQGSKRGMQWSIPYSLSPPRDDLDKSGGRCVVYDSVFHPDTLLLAEKNQRFRAMINDTAMDGIESNFNVKLDRTNLKFPKMKYKGTPAATVIRTPREEGETEIEDGYKAMGMTYPYDQPSTSSASTSVKTETKISGSRKSDNDPNAPTEPKHTIVHRGHLDLQNFRNAPDAAPSTRPQELVITIQLPLLKSAKNVNLDIYEKRLCMESSGAAAYKLDVKLPYPVNENEGSAKFDKSKKCLIVTIPVLPPVIPALPSFMPEEEKQLVEELPEKGEETAAEKEGEDKTMEEEAVVDVVVDNKLVDAQQIGAENVENGEPRISEETQPELASPISCQNHQEDGETSETSTDIPKEDEASPDCQQKVYSEDLDSDELSEEEHFDFEVADNNVATVEMETIYLMPEFSYRQDTETVTFVLHVPGVKADSVKKELIGGLSGVHITMETIPENTDNTGKHYSFYVQFLPDFSISPDIICDVFNDKAILILKKMTTKGNWKQFEVGKDAHSLEERSFLDGENLQNTIDTIVKRTLEETTKYQDKHMDCEVTESTEDKLVIELKPSTGGGDSKLASTDNATTSGKDMRQDGSKGKSAETVARQMKDFDPLDIDDVFPGESGSSSASSPVDRDDPDAPRSAFKSPKGRVAPKSVSFNETVVVENFKERSKKTQKKKPGKVEVSFRTKERLKESSEEESESPSTPTSPFSFTDKLNIKEKGNRPGSPKKGKNKSKSKSKECAKHKKSEDAVMKRISEEGGKTEADSSPSNSKSGVAFSNTLMFDLD